MSKQMSKNFNDLVTNNFWSASKFSFIGQQILPKLAHIGIEIQYGRTVLWLKRNELTIKVYPHYKGKTNDFLTFTDIKGHEIKSFNTSSTVDEIWCFLKETLYF